MSGLDHLAVLVGEPRHAEVGDLAQLIVIHEDVPGGEVAVDNLRAEKSALKLSRAPNIQEKHLYVKKTHV